MTELSQEIVERWQIRKNAKQKTAFIAFLQARLPGLRAEEEKGRPRCRNLVLGDLNSARVIFSAHYDTCAVMPIPNAITPKNIPLYLLYNLLLCLVFFAVAFAVAFVVKSLTHMFWLAYWSSLLVLFLCLFLLMAGKPNSHTVNDNTSGVITLCEIWAALSEEEKKRTALVFFDNEELGLLGSGAFRKRHKQELKDKLLINFDCVSDGDHFLFIQNKAARVNWENDLKGAFLPPEGKQVYWERSSRVIYPSDQMGFPCSIGVAAFRRHRVFGLYLSRIHTKHDTVLQRENIDFLQKGAVSLIRALGEKSEVNAHELA